jgi:hypothetical protein
MFLFRMKIEELDVIRLSSLKEDLTRSERALRQKCPIREMSLISQNDDKPELDIYLALDDFIGTEQLRRLVGELTSLIELEAKTSRSARPRVSSELIHI